jgi:hypothetical protein
MNRLAVLPLRPRRILLALGTLALLALSWVIAPEAHALDSGDIFVTAIQGEVEFTLNGTPRALKDGAALVLPAIVRTGKNGSVELRQGHTSIQVGPGTELHFPATEVRRGPVDRIIQPRGNVFYDVGKRNGRLLRVETPVLVGVVKGTQFNVAVLDDGAAISLFEGRLEILDASGGSVDLQAGEIAARRQGESATRVLKMSSNAPSGAAPRTSSNVRAAGSELSAGNGRDAGADADDNVSSSLLASDMNLASAGAVLVPVDPVGNTPEVPVEPAQPDVGSGAPDDGGVPPDIGAPVDSPVPPDLGAGGDGAAPSDGGAGGLPVVDTGAPPVDVGPDLGTGPDAGAEPDLGTGPDLGTDPEPVPDLDIDDGNNGHGNDDDRDDSSNPGRSGNKGREK